MLFYIFPLNHSLHFSLTLFIRSHYSVSKIRKKGYSLYNWGGHHFLPVFNNNSRKCWPTTKLTLLLAHYGWNLPEDTSHMWSMILSFIVDPFYVSSSWMPFSSLYQLIAAVLALLAPSTPILTKPSWSLISSFCATAPGLRFSWPIWEGIWLDFFLLRLNMQHLHFFVSAEPVWLRLELLVWSHLMLLIAQLFNG